VHQRDAVLRRDETAIGFSQCFVADKVLVHPGQPGPAQGGKVVSNERFKSNVASLGYQHRADAGPEIVNAGFALANTSKLCREICASRDLEQYLW
jgi:hypothetical protein